MKSRCQSPPQHIIFPSFFSNYGPTILTQQIAEKQGLQQVLWLFGEDHQITEVGTMNMFMFWINEDGGIYLYLLIMIIIIIIAFNDNKIILQSFAITTEEGDITPLFVIYISIGECFFRDRTVSASVLYDNIKTEKIYVIVLKKCLLIWRNRVYS